MAVKVIGHALLTMQTGFSLSCHHTFKWNLWRQGGLSFCRMWTKISNTTHTTCTNHQATYWSKPSDSQRRILLNPNYNSLYLHWGFIKDVVSHIGPILDIQNTCKHFVVFYHFIIWSILGPTFTVSQLRWSWHLIMMPMGCCLWRVSKHVWLRGSPDPTYSGLGDSQGGVA